MKYSRILGVAAALLVTSAMASPATTPPAASSITATPASTSSSAQPAAATEPAMPVAAAPADATPAHWGDAKAGQAKSGTCAACHGADGNSTDAQYPKLAGQHERVILKQLKAFKSGDRENPIMMPMASGLSEQDMRDIGAYFATQKAGAGVADDSLVAEGKPHAGEKYWQVGERLWRAGNSKAGIPACLACHGPTGRGNPGAAYPALAGQHASYTSARLNYFRAAGDKAKVTSGTMVDIAKRLSDEEIQGLATYAEGLHPAAAARKAD